MTSELNVELKVGDILKYQKKDRFHLIFVTNIKQDKIHFKGRKLFDSLLVHKNQNLLNSLEHIRKFDERYEIVENCTEENFKEMFIEWFI